jgi:hypothetical protein
MQATRVHTGQLPKLLHVQTNTYIDLPLNLSVIHIGKPNDRIPPDIDVSNLPDSIVLQSMTLLSFLLTFGAISAGYQLFTAGKILNYHLFDLKKILKN